MQDITKGTLLGNRYELVSETYSGEFVSRWIARDDKLGRDVALTVFRNDSANAEAALDSARRVAGLEDHRILRVLDAGRDDEYAYIVEEAHLGAHTLADLARFDYLHPEEARRITGEVAAALEAARQRGLHHLILDPRKVLRLADGSIVVTEMAVGASLAGEDDVTSAEANSIDTRALVQLLYFALTRTWAGGDIPGADLKPAERRADGQLPTPAEILENTPNDLDTLCRQTLNYNEAPRTPGEVAKLVSPWSSQMISAPGRVKQDAPTTDSPSFTLRKAKSGGSSRAGVGAVGAAAMGGAAAAKSAKSAGDAKSYDSDATEHVDIMSGRLAGNSHTQDPADATMIGRAPAFDADETTQFSLDDEDMAYTRTTYDPSFEELEPPVPGLHSGVDDPDSSSSKLALAIVALFVLLALFLAVLGLRNITGAGSSPAASSSQTAASPDAKPSATSSSSSSSSSSSQPGQDVQLSQARIVQSDGTVIRESDYAFQAIDGNAATAWKSLFYKNTTWGGYPNRGGLAATLAERTAVKTVTVEPGDFPLTADIYVGDQPGTSGTKVGSVQGATSKQTIEADGAEGRYVTVYVTKMDQTAQGSFRASVAELTVQK